MVGCQKLGFSLKLYHPSHVCDQVYCSATIADENLYDATQAEVLTDEVVSLHLVTFADFPAHSQTDHVVFPWKLQWQVTERNAASPRIKWQIPQALNIVGNICHNVSTQLNKIHNNVLSVRQSNAELLLIISLNGLFSSYAFGGALSSHYS